MTTSGTTTRNHAFSRTHPVTKVVSGFRTVPAGTEVHVSSLRGLGIDTTCEVRLPGTPYTARVLLAQVEPA